jgi:hypothetical protein
MQLKAVFLLFAFLMSSGVSGARQLITGASENCCGKEKCSDSANDKHSDSKDSCTSFQLCCDPPITVSASLNVKVQSFPYKKIYSTVTVNHLAGFSDKPWHPPQV